MVNLESKIYIAGHRGMVGSAIWRTLTAKGYTNLIGASSAELDLRHQQAVRDFISAEKPDIIIDALCLITRKIKVKQIQSISP